MPVNYLFASILGLLYGIFKPSKKFYMHFGYVITFFNIQYTYIVGFSKEVYFKSEGTDS